MGTFDSDTWLQSQDIVDPMGLMHDPKATRESKAAAEEYGQTALGMQQDWMDYIKSEYAPYSEVAGEALTAQRGLAGIGEPGAREQMVTDIEADPFYQAKVRAGEEAVLRGASATGGLRSGGTSEALAKQNQMMLGGEIENRYQKLAGLSGQGFMGQQEMGAFGGQNIGEMTGTLGSLASGEMAYGAAEQDKKTGLMGLAGGIFSAFSDERLKTNINKIGVKHGLPWYEWEWNKTASDELDLNGKTQGHMVSDVEFKYPELVGEHKGYKTVNYGGLA